MSEIWGKSEHEKLWKKFEDSFCSRRWQSIRLAWPAFVPKPTDLIDNAPETTLTELVGQGGVLMSVPERNKLSVILHPRSEIPEIVFKEAVRWMHKALHVLGASEMHVEQGLPSWSLSSAYQSAYFAARSIMAFFGVSIAEFGHVSVAVDLFRNMQGLRPQKIVELGAFEKEVPFRSIGALFDHRQTWQLFQRILRTCTCEVWPEGWANYFAQLDMADLTRQRHGLHYQLKYWVLDDLHDFVYDDEFNDVEPAGNGRELFDSESPNFSLAVSYALTKMALSLFKDICPLTSRLATEQLNVAKIISFERHPIFFDAIQR